MAWKNLETSLRDSLFTSINNNIRLKQKSSKDYFRQKSENWKSQHSQYCRVRFPTRKVPFSNLDNEHIFKIKYQLSPLTLWNSKSWLEWLNDSWRPWEIWHRVSFLRTPQSPAITITHLSIISWLVLIDVFFKSFCDSIFQVVFVSILQHLLSTDKIQEK